MSKTLNQLFNVRTESKEVALTKLWNDPQTQPSLQRLINAKLEEEDDIAPSVLIWDIGQTPQDGLQDFLLIICLKFDGATEENEPWLVAHLLCLSLLDKNPLPLLSEHQGKAFWAKTLTTLSFFPEALKHRMERHGAPSPDTYRSRSKSTMINTGQAEHIALANHHELWEDFLQSKFPIAT